MKYFKSLSLTVFFAWHFTGCDKPPQYADSSAQFEKALTDSIDIPEGKLVWHWGENGLPKRVYHLDHGQLKENYAFEYKENGALTMISQWKNGKKHGDSFVFEGGKVKEHQLFRSGKLIYKGIYDDQVKVDNRLYPRFIEEFFFEDKYYAKLRFENEYTGRIQVKVKSKSDVIITQLEEQTFQLVINDALDLDTYDLHFSYQPAAGDTLVASAYGYQHVVYSE